MALRAVWEGVRRCAAEVRWKAPGVLFSWRKNSPRLRRAVAETAGSPREQLRAFFNASFSPPNLDSDVLAVWVVFWGLYRHAKDSQRVQSETYQGYIDLLRGMLADLEKVTGKLRFNLRLAAIGLTALIDGLWLEWCLDPENFEPREAVELCEAWVESLEG